MRPKSMVLILIALGCGLIASIGISQVVERNSNSGGDEVQTQPIFVAMRDMSIGEELNANSVRLEEWPLDKIPEGAITDATQIEGMCPNQRLFAGEPLLLGKIVDASLHGLSSKKIKKGYRVMSVKVDMASSVSYLITPGDRVDVMAFNSGRAQAEVILSNVEVFAINEHTTREIDSESGGSLQAKTVSLLVTPAQATKLMASSYQGRINLSLRRPDDEEAGGFDEEPESIAAVETQPEKSFFDAFQPAAAQEPEFVMEVMEGGSSQSVRRFAWNGNDNLPREIGGTGDMGGGDAFDDEISDDFPFPPGGSGGPENEDEESPPSPADEAFRFN